MVWRQFVKPNIASGVGVLLFVACTTLSVYVLSVWQSTFAWVAHTYEVSGTLQRLHRELLQCELLIYEKAVGRIQTNSSIEFAKEGLFETSRQLESLVTDNPSELAAARMLRGKLENFFATALSQQEPRTPEALSGTVSLVGEMQAMLEEMKARERTLLGERIAQSNDTGRIASWLEILGGITALYLIVSAAIKVQRLALKFVRTERLVEEKNRALLESNRELEAFSYSVSHDLRAPLRAMSGYADMLLEDYGAGVPAEGQRFIRTIKDNAQFMGELIDDLLTFSRLSREALSKRAVDMENIVREIWAELQRQFPESKAELELRHLPQAEADPKLFRHVWQNLLSNAFKFSARSEKPLVSVTGRLVDGICTYAVKDNGVGFDMKYAHKLFGVFQRLHRREEFEGTGVGLAIVQRIVRRHNGRVWAESALGEGATFYFSIPVSSALPLTVEKEEIHGVVHSAG